VSVYGVHKLLHRIQVDTVLRSTLRTDPAGALADFDLDGNERSALLAGDVATLARLGAHTFLLSRLARFGAFGLDRETYITRMRTLLDDA